MVVLGVDPGIKTGAMVGLDVSPGGVAQIVHLVIADGSETWPRLLERSCAGMRADAAATEWHFRRRGSSPTAGAAHASAGILKQVCDTTLKPTALVWRDHLGAPRMRRAEAKRWAIGRADALGAPAHMLRNDHVCEALLLAVYAADVGLDTRVLSVSS